jgi:anti-sigma regulatory factor (Ser/Thr protein kinase)
MTGDDRRRQTFPATPASAAEARRFVESVMSTAHLDNLAYTATMLVSELVANAILHTGTPLEVVVCPEPDSVRIEVHDGSAQLPIRKHYSNMSGTGRGLLLVERMASEWGADRTTAGKVVWFQLDSTSSPVIDILGAEAL